MPRDPRSESSDPPCGERCEANPLPSSPWSWKPGGLERSEHPRLLYEPGSWGDVLKGTWAELTIRAITRRGASLRCVDPFAGSATYPAAEAVRERAEWLGRGPWVRAQEPFLARGMIASTSRILCDVALEIGATVKLSVFDADPSRLASWSELDCSAEIDALAIGDGADAIGDADADLVLVDPYDFVGRAADLLPRVLAQRKRSTVLVYLFNRAPRGGGHERTYRAVREKLAREKGALLVGRIPSDAILPRAWHEVLLFGPEPFPDTLARELGRATRALTCKLSTSGAFEDASGFVPRDGNKE